MVTNGEVTEKQYCDLLNEAEDAKPRGERSFHIVCKCNPVDPANVASYARTLVDNDKKASDKKNGGVSDPYDHIYVVVDVDDYLINNPASLRKAQKVCDENGMHLVVSDPCFEVWLIDHVMTCPSHIATQDKAENLAKSKGLTTGRGNKYLDFGKLRGRTGIAVRNAEAHNLPGASVLRKSLQGKSFAPWTDFSNLVRDVGAS